ncbi:Ribosomal_RNA assembly protein KRR1 [Hexamita inflata]|uniref:KRR-R motif-containing protein 1 n=1 Tax=Hexamita inflata TaxID=28002 RepID=A0AA86NHY2_9EUKA|nr:Ribosomal RNA assembly protein KRR1 [Hexamita inflata]
MPDEMDVKEQKQEQEIYDPTEFLPESFQPMLEENEFEVMIPKNRIQYFVEYQAQIQALFDIYKIKFNMNVAKQTVYVTSTQQTFDPTSVLIARQFLKLLARYVDLNVAQKVFLPNVESEIINVNLCQEQETFLKRRLRFIGDNRQTLTTLELLTNTNLSVYGSTLCVIGSARGIQLIQKISRDVFAKNVLPTFWIKTLMVRRELEKVPELKDQNWSQFMPQLKKSKSRRKTLKIERKAPAEERGIVDVGKYSERKIDKQIETGEIAGKVYGKNKEGGKPFLGKKFDGKKDAKK